MSTCKLVLTQLGVMSYRATCSGHPNWSAKGTKKAVLSAFNLHARQTNR